MEAENADYAIVLVAWTLIIKHCVIDWVHDKKKKKMISSFED